MVVRKSEHNNHKIKDKKKEESKQAQKNNKAYVWNASVWRENKGIELKSSIPGLKIKWICTGGGWFQIIL